jgi:hypothetical protein
VHLFRNHLFLCTSKKNQSAGTLPNPLAAFSITFWVGYWPRVEGWAFSCLLQTTFKESHILGVPHSNNISQLGTGLSKVLWVAGCKLWSRRVHMWRAHNGVAIAGSASDGRISTHGTEHKIIWRYGTCSWKIKKKKLLAATNDVVEITAAYRLWLRRLFIAAFTMTVCQCLVSLLHQEYMYMYMKTNWVK